MLCKKCGQEIPENEKNCPGCGEQVKKTSVAKLLLIIAGIGCAGFLTIVLLFLAIFYPNYARARGQGQVTACKANLKNIATALEMYAVDNGGRFPPSLEYIAKSGIGSGYLNEIPECPSAKKDTYSSSYTYRNGRRASFKLYCSGHNHKAVGLEANTPGYDSYTGLYDNPRGY